MRELAIRALTVALALGALAGAGGVQAKPEKKLEPTFKDLGHIHGYLLAPSGEALRGVIALCTPEGKRISTHHSNSVRKGRFDIDNLFPGRYVLKVESIGPIIEDLDRPAPVEVEVLPNKVVRPRLVAR